MEELKIKPIRNGTVIDHIPRGQALNVLRILGVGSETRDVVSVGMNIPSEKMGNKDIVKVEGREIESHEADILSLIAPEATVNVVRDYDVTEKYDVSMPDKIEGVLGCPNRSCITNTPEPVETEFSLDEGVPRCVYCDTVLSEGVPEYLV